MRFLSVSLLMFLTAVSPALPQNVQQDAATNPAAATKARTDQFREHKIVTNLTPKQASKRKFPLWAKVAIAGGGIAGSALLIRSVSRPVPNTPVGTSIRVEGQQ
jgi:hypothetical protein